MANELRIEMSTACPLLNHSVEKGKDAFWVRNGFVIQRIKGKLAITDKADITMLFTYQSLAKLAKGNSSGKRKRASGRLAK